MSSAWAMAARSLGRDWRAGELRVLAAALVVAVGAVTAVGFLTDRVERAMDRQAATLLGGDLVLAGSRAPRPALLREARERGLEVARTVDFPSVVLAGERTQLVQVKAVGPHYPLRGRLKVANRPFGRAVATGAVPAAGEAWVDPRLPARLGLAMGERLKLGARRFEIARVIDYEPDRDAQLFRLAPRVLIDRASLEATGLVTAASRVRYRTLFAGPAQAVADYRAWAEPRLAAGETLQGVRGGRAEVRVAYDRASRYLGLAALVAVLVAGAAIALAARHYAERQADAGAIMRCLGASQRLVMQIYGLRLLLLGIVASLVGCGLGYGAQTALADLLEGWFVESLPAPGPGALATGLMTGLLGLAGFALPPILRLGQVPPLRVLRRELGNPTPAAWLTGLCAVGALAVLLALQAPEATLIGRMLLGAGVTVAGLWLGALALLRGLAWVQPRVGLAWGYGLARLARRRGLGALQITMFALGIAALLVLAVVRLDLLDTWRATLPTDAPNHFMLNIRAGDLESLRGLFGAHDLPAPSFYPMVRARLVAIDGNEVGPQSYENLRAQRLVAREFNLSWARRLAADNRVVAGSWWGDQARGLRALSVERGIADTLGIELGDTLSFRVAGETLSAPVTNLRAVDWDSFNVNFFVLAAPGLLEDYPTNWVCSFFLPPGRSRLLLDITRQFPGVTVLDVDAIMRQVRTIMDRAAQAVEYVFVFTLGASLLVMIAAVQAGGAERRQETALLRALGARRGQVLRGLAAELGGIGLAAALMAALAASVATWLLASQVFELPLRVNPWVWVWALAGGAGVTLAGLLATRRTLDQSPLLVLRRG